MNPSPYAPPPPVKTRPCPCGCGETLRSYNGHLPWVCYRTWQLIPKEARAVIMSPAVSTRERRQAARQVFEIAREVRNHRATPTRTAGPLTTDHCTDN
jgi:hypothetical protein